MRWPVQYQVHCERNGCLVKKEPITFDILAVSLLGVIGFSIPFITGIQKWRAKLAVEEHRQGTRVTMNDGGAAMHSVWVIAKYNDGTMRGVID